MQSVTSGETWYSNIEKDALCILHGHEIPSLLFCLQSQCDSRPHTTVDNVQKRCSELITEATKNITMHLPVEHRNTVQIWAMAVHSRLAGQRQPQHNWSHRVMHGHSRLHDNKRN